MAIRRDSIRRRLAATEGISFLIALAFMLVCFAIAAVVISSAGVNAERVKQHKAEEQGYFAAQSALELVDGAARRDGSLLGDPNRLTLTGSADNWVPGSSVPTNDLGLAKWAAEQARQVGKGNKPGSKTITIPGFQHDGAVVPDVEVTFAMRGSGNYDIQIAASVLPADEKTASSYANVLYKNYKANPRADGIEWEEADA